MRLQRVKAARGKTVKLAPNGSLLIQLDEMTTKTFPVIGDNRLSCMMKGCLPSRGIYDPMTPVDLAKLHKLKDYLSSPDRYGPLYLNKLLSTTCLHYLCILTFYYLLAKNRWTLE